MHRPISRDEEIRERVKIPVDDRLGGCRGFESHRPHHYSTCRNSSSDKLSTVSMKEGYRPSTD